MPKILSWHVQDVTMLNTALNDVWTKTVFFMRLNAVQTLKMSNARLDQSFDS